MRAYNRRPLDNLDHTRRRDQRSTREARRANPAEEMPAWHLQLDSGELLVDPGQLQFDEETVTHTGRMAGRGLMQNYMTQGAFSNALSQNFADLEQRILANIPLHLSPTFERLQGAINENRIRHREGGLISADAEAPFRIDWPRMPDPPPLHPCAGMVVAKPLRTMCGFVVEDVRQGDGSVARRVVNPAPK